MIRFGTHQWLGILLLGLALLNWRCGGDASTALDRAARTALAPTPPKGMVFDYLLYDNDFNAVPTDAQPEYYVASVLDSPKVGLVYRLSREQAFAPGLYAQLDLTPEQVYYRIELEVLQYAKDVMPALQRGFVVVSLTRKDSTIVYQPYSIDEWMATYQRHLVDKWETLTLWHPLEAAQAGDQLKIYVWNPEGGLLYLNNLKIEVWRPKPRYDQTHQKSHVLTELSYEGANWGPEQTQEQAYRGIGAALLYNGNGGTAFGRGYQGTLEAANIGAQDVLQIEVVGLKQHGVRQAERAARLVCAMERNGQALDWKGWAIDWRLYRDGAQTYNEWHPLTWWVPLPEGVKPSDVLQVYPWNNTEQRIFLDDLRVTVWKPKE